MSPRQRALQFLRWRESARGTDYTIDEGRSAKSHQTLRDYDRVILRRRRPVDHSTSGTAAVDTEFRRFERTGHIPKDSFE